MTHTTPPALYSGEIPTSEVIAQLKAQIAQKDKALEYVSRVAHAYWPKEHTTTSSVHRGWVIEQADKALALTPASLAAENRPLYVVTHEGAKPILYAALEADMARIDKLESLSIQMGQADWRITTAPGQQHCIAIRTGHKHAFPSLRAAIDAIGGNNE